MLFMLPLYVRGLRENQPSFDFSAGENQKALKDLDGLTFELNTMAGADLEGLPGFRSAVDCNEPRGNTLLGCSPALAKAHELQQLVELDKFFREFEFKIRHADILDAGRIKSTDE